MSLEAMKWVLDEAPDVPPHLVGTLLALANGAHGDGTRSLQSVPTLCWYTRKTERAVQNDIKALLDAQLIRLGNQAASLYLPVNVRPIVYDLALERKREPRPLPGRPGRPSRADAVVENPVENPVYNLPTNGVHSTAPLNSSVNRGAVQGEIGVQPTAPNPKALNPSTNPAARADDRILEVLADHGCSGDEAAAIRRRIVAAQRAPVRSIAALVNTIAAAGELADLLDEVRHELAAAGVGAAMDEFRAALRVADECDDGVRGGELIHPETGRRFCALCRIRAGAVAA